MKNFLSFCRYAVKANMIRPLAYVKLFKLFTRVLSDFKQQKGNGITVPFLSGRGDGIRTHDLLVPNQARYHLRYASYPPIIVFFLPSVNQKSICNRNKLFRFCAYCRSLIPRYGCKPQKLSRFGAKYGVFCDYPHRLIKYVNIVAIRVKV